IFCDNILGEKFSRTSCTCSRTSFFRWRRNL
ncbi:preprotein translocase, SecG subunit, partial [Chlamydia psittaci 06-1683]